MGSGVDGRKAEVVAPPPVTKSHKVVVALTARMTTTMTADDDGRWMSYNELRVIDPDLGCTAVLLLYGRCDMRNLAKRHAELQSICCCELRDAIERRAMSTMVINVTISWHPQLVK